MVVRVALIVMLAAILSGGPPPAIAQETVPGDNPADSDQSGSEIGSIVGVVADRRSGDPIGDAGVELVGTGQTVRTDLNGSYRARAKPGTYELRMFAAGYRSTRIEDVNIRSRETTKVDASLEPLALAGVEIIEVVAQAGPSTEATQLLFRKKAAVVSDTLSAELIKKTPGATAADLVTRMPAVTVREGDKLVIRGLLERYTSTMLNGNFLPSTDPERRAVPLDLFPGEFLQSINVLKTYTPDLPGNFGAGIVDFGLKDAPPQLGYSLSLGGTFNSQTTFDDFATYKGSKYDPFGLGKDFRDIPKGTPSNVSSTDPKRFDIGRRFRDIWAVKTETAGPGFEAKASIGNTLGPFGFQLGGIFSNEYQDHGLELLQKVTQSRTNPDDPSEPLVVESFRGTRDTFATRLGGLLTSFYQIGWDQKLTLRGLVNRVSKDEVQQSIGTYENIKPALQQQVTLNYEEQELVWGQFSGEHAFPWLRVDWRSAISQTTADEPDQRFEAANGPADGPFTFTEDSEGGQRLFNTMEEFLSDTAFDVSVPFETGLPGTDVWKGLPGKLKTGWAYLYRHRKFRQRRFVYMPNQNTQDLTEPYEVLFAPKNIGPGGADFSEATAKRDSFKANETVLAGYGMLELPIVRDQLRLIGGVRYEDSDISLNIFESETDEQETEIKKPNNDFFPGVSLVYSPMEDMNFRGAFSQTVSRPDFRELSPAEFPAQRGQRAKFGNPNLEQATLTNWDARWEWFFSPQELVSLSFFYKKIDSPIEATVITRGSEQADTFVNAKDGNILGVEFEGRKDFGFLWEPLRFLSINTNVTWANSSVTSEPEVTFGEGTTLTATVTNLKRSLQGQPDFTINTVLEYAPPRWGTFRLLYRTEDDSISKVGTNDLSDIIQTRRDQVDAVFITPLDRWLNQPLTLKLAIKNILNGPYKETQDDITLNKYTAGVTFGISLTYSP